MLFRSATRTRTPKHEPHPRLCGCVCVCVPPSLPLVSDPLPDAHIRSQIRAATHVLPHGPAPPGTAAGGVLRHGTATACRARRRVACVRAAICEEQPALGMPSPMRRRRPQDHDLVLSQHHQRLTANLARGRVDAWPRQRPHSPAGARASAGECGRWRGQASTLAGRRAGGRTRSAFRRHPPRRRPPSPSAVPMQGPRLSRARSTTPITRGPSTFHRAVMMKLLLAAAVRTRTSPVGTTQRPSAP